MEKTENRNGKRVGFISTRLAGTDGVSLETEKWAWVLAEDGFECFYLAGELEKPPEKSMTVAEAHFTHPGVMEIQEGCFGSSSRPRRITEKVDLLKSILKDRIYEFLDRFNIHCLIIENALAIPVNIPLGLALTEILAETAIPAIAHHHDFFWERKRFSVNAAADYLCTAFPPEIPSVKHVVINTPAGRSLSYRKGVAAAVIPNVMDFETAPPAMDAYASDARQALGFTDGEHFVLQPTRVVQRKGIEHAIELLKRIDMHSKLVISHAPGDEGNAYEGRVREYASLMNVDAVFVSEIIKEKRGISPQGKKIYTIWDIYPHADLVTYPSNFEGFGNAFLEALYFKKPLVVNRYSVYETDIRPKGFEMIEINDFIPVDTVNFVREVLADGRRAEDMVEKNYELGRKHFSYSVLREKLRVLMGDCLSGHS